MTADGLALGILDWGTGVVVPLSPFGANPLTAAFLSSGLAGTRLDAAIAAFRGAYGLDLTLVTGGPVNPVCLPDA